MLCFTKHQRREIENLPLNGLDKLSVRQRGISLNDFKESDLPSELQNCGAPRNRVNACTLKLEWKTQDDAVMGEKVEGVGDTKGTLRQEVVECEAMKCNEAFIIKLSPDKEEDTMVVTSKNDEAEVEQELLKSMNARTCQKMS
ncbi:hypothetical protein GOBAR_DD33169 [Gossypium barbadense]|nr:hypothetical protein GOBAR_DD33169 [Gossypium barbadense]